LARPHRCRGVGRYTPLALESAVELRLGEKRASRLEDLIGPAQLLDFALQGLDAFALVAAYPITRALINLVALDPIAERLGNATDLVCNRFNASPQRGVLASVLLHHTDSALAHFW